jgi:hypothetical protein
MDYKKAKPFITKYFRYYDFVTLNPKTKKERVNNLEAAIIKKVEGKSKDIVRLDKIIYTFN